MSAERRSEINRSLSAIGNEPRKVLDFLKAFGHRSQFTFPASLDGVGPVRVTIPITQENIGAQNHGVFYFDREGEPRVLKLLGERPSLVKELAMARGEPMALNDPDRFTLLHFARELEGAALGEEEGAPTIQRFGTVNYRGRDYLAIEMEELFPGQRRVTAKEAVRLQSAPFNPFEKTHPSTGVSVSRQMSDLYLKAILRDKNPNDADFMISEHGEVRWIDTAGWRSSNWRDRSVPDGRRGSVGHSLSTFVEMLSEKHPGPAREFVDSLATCIRFEPSLKPDERAWLLQELFSEDLQMRFDQAKSLSAYRSRIGL